MTATNRRSKAATRRGPSLGAWVAYFGAFALAGGVVIAVEITLLGLGVVP